MYHILADDYNIYWDESADEMVINPSNSAIDYNSRVAEYEARRSNGG
jgi:hypothetical protein